MNVITGMVMFVLSLADIKNKRISVLPVIGMGTVLLIFRLLSGVSAGELFCGLIPGGILFLIAVLSREKLGKGDGLVALSLGLGYGIEKIAVMTGIALFSAAAVSAVLLVLGRVNRKTELPFLPFLFLGWLIGVCIG